ncbi:hypothetical protein J2S71_000686 [Olsenella profusa DSM 13989]|mgnify:CR=1 FL=1|uniref:Uncharacterized protein n=1 Tax=Olsenella profusa F0195 TaxID=1125712 RepID=U2THN1_9ACTN|nr:hypothetical protein HMPREF1316_0825 [Olsenella profusa F0195]MDP9858990.1 hypothetical protein [Olsenella profusa DSM 13989]
MTGAPNNSATQFTIVCDLAVGAPRVIAALEKLLDINEFESVGAGVLEAAPTYPHPAPCPMRPVVSWAAGSV